jgi:serine/threonine protein phosphatase PrpC
MLIRNCGQSDLGRSRSVNEDSFLIDESQQLYVVADGMGGHGNGEIASRVAVDALADYLRGHPVSNGNEAERLRKAIECANREVLAEVARDGDLAGMGATIVAMVLDGSRGLIGSVGDSRAYRFRQGVLEQLTEDHTWVHEQVSAGLLSEEDARQHPFRSVITRAVGGGEEVVADLVPVDLNPGDRVLLCSDGLTSVLSDLEITVRIQRRESLETVCRELVDAANARGGPDNITVLLVEVAKS